MYTLLLIINVFLVRSQMLRHYFGSSFWADAFRWKNFKQHNSLWYMFPLDLSKYNQGRWLWSCVLFSLLGAVLVTNWPCGRTETSKGNVLKGDHLIYYFIWYSTHRNTNRTGSFNRTCVGCRRCELFPWEPIRIDVLIRWNELNVRRGIFGSFR